MIERDPFADDRLPLFLLSLPCTDVAFHDINFNESMGKNLQKLITLGMKRQIFPEVVLRRILEAHI
jgi:hypothetical protein